MGAKFKVGDQVRVAARPHPFLGAVAYADRNGQLAEVTEVVQTGAYELPGLAVRESGNRYGLRFSDGTTLEYADEEHLSGE